MPDSVETAKQLRDMADEYEKAAEQLRAAADLVFAMPSLNGSAAASEADSEDAATDSPVRASITEADYLAVFERHPAQKRNAAAVGDALRRAGKPPVSIDAVRTAIYRLAAAGKLEKVGHGLYRLAR